MTEEPSFIAIGVSSHYRSDQEDIVQDFYVPTLTVAESYDRAVGYFTATSLALVSRGLDSFISRGCRMRLIASPQLEEEDLADIRNGYELREILEKATVRSLVTSDERLLDGLGQLGKMIAMEQLDIKLAFVENPRGYGMYHEKIGLLRDCVGNAIAFTGSANETHGGLVSNFETVEVFRSWQLGENERVLRLMQDFESLWRDKTPTLRVVEFPSVAIERLLVISRQNRPPLLATDNALRGSVESGNEDVRGRLTIPRSLIVRDYQREAVAAWFKADGRGIFKMATGTGKTKTALAAAAQLAQLLARRETRLITLIVAPYQHLVDQWLEEVAAFGVTAVGAYESSHKWVHRAGELLTAVNLGSIDGAVIVCTNATLLGRPLQELLGRTQQPLLVIADEVHNLGSARLSAALPDFAAYRLALSATPERHFDDAGSQRLLDYFGPVVFDLDLGDAIRLGALCPYIYQPRLVQLDEPETDLYVQLSDAIAALLASGDDLDSIDDDSPLGALLRQRSQVLGHANGKLPLFASDLSDRADKWFQLVYCAEGRKPQEDGPPDGPRQIEQVLQLVGVDQNLSVNQYVSETPRSVRRQLLARFGSGTDLRVLASMRCLDEGVDIPDARVAYLLASSSNPRQFVQRRGRILRPAPGKDHAEIIDYLAIPPPDAMLSRPELERRLVGREMTRAAEFARLAMNQGEALEILRPLKQQYGLMDL